MCSNFQSSASCDVDINQSVADDYSSEPAPYLPRTELQEVLLPQVGVQEDQAAHQIAVGEVLAAAGQAQAAEATVGQVRVQEGQSSEEVSNHILDFTKNL